MSEKKACPCCCEKHTARSEEEKKKLINRLKRIEGQIRGIIGMMENDAYKPEVISEDQMVLLARDIAKKIEEELEYPGQIKVHLLRETKAIEYAK